MSDETITVEPELVAAEAARKERIKKPPVNNAPPRVYAAMSAVSADLGKEGIGKTHTNDQQKYKFRSVDDVANALSPLLPKHKLLMLPRMIERHSSERQARSGGGTIFTTLVEMEFDFVSTEDGSMHTIRMFGEAMDSGDKSTTKAASAAFKYACFQAFCIPTEGEDADATTHEVAPLPAAGAAPLPTSKPWKNFTTPGPARVAKPMAPVSEMAAGVIEGAVLIENVRATKTRNANVTRYIITDSNGEDHATIKEKLAMDASQYKQTRTPVRLDTQQTQYGSELLHIRPLEVAALAEPGEGDDVPVYDGETPPF